MLFLLGVRVQVLLCPAASYATGQLLVQSSMAKHVLTKPSLWLSFSWGFSWTTVTVVSNDSKQYTSQKNQRIRARLVNFPHNLVCFMFYFIASQNLSNLIPRVSPLSTLSTLEEEVRLWEQGWRLETTWRQSSQLCYAFFIWMISLMLLLWKGETILHFNKVNNKSYRFS